MPKRPFRWAMNSGYPQNPAHWRLAIHHGTGISELDGRRAFEEGRFPYYSLEQWIRAEFRQGFSPDFVPALLRNIRGLVAWVYGDGEEPYWPGSDSSPAPA